MATTTAFLSFARHYAMKKADGLTEEKVRRVMVDSGTSILGLRHHLTVGEKYWSGYHLRGARTDVEWDSSLLSEPPA